MTTYRIADRRRWTSVSNEAIEDASVSFRARGLLVWLLSKPDGWQVKSEVIASSGIEGRDAIRTALTELEAVGYIRRERTQDDQGRWVNSCSIYESPKTDFQAPVSPASVFQASSTKDSEAITDEQSSSLRSEEELNDANRVDTKESVTPTTIAKEYWDWHVADRGKAPTSEFKAVMGLAKRLLKSGYGHDEIVDALKNAKVMTAKALSDDLAATKHKRDETPNTQRIPASIVRAFAKCEPWFARRNLMLTGAQRQHWMQLCASQVNFGYGPGETMLRMAVALRSDNASTWGLSDAKVDRFNGEIADYPDAMERAYVNQAWSAR